MNLAYKLRPTCLENFVGQKHIVGSGKILRNMIENTQLPSIIFWGPPGVGKTTLAHIIAKESNSDFYTLSGVSAGKDDLKEVVRKAEKSKNKTILFIDEIHRWNKAQQDALLPFVESGLITLIGATTENPSFEVIGALLSRSRVFILQNLGVEDLKCLIKRALTDNENGLGKYKKKISLKAEELLTRLSGGDARVLLNALEIAVTTDNQEAIDEELIKEIFQTRSAGLYDKIGEEHYNTISAFIKSMRGSNIDAALYYLSRMLISGEDPTYIARRMIIFASEDIGLADRGALIQANEAFEAVQKVGMPESQLILAHVAVYLARAPKSRQVPNALADAMQTAREFPNEPIPLHLRNAPNKLMKELGYAKGYSWGDSYVGLTEGQSFLPEKIKNKKFWK